jgi:hypothetical protein
MKLIVVVPKVFFSMIKQAEPKSEKYSTKWVAEDHSNDAHLLLFVNCQQSGAGKAQVYNRERERDSSTNNDGV